MPVTYVKAPVFPTQPEPLYSLITQLLKEAKKEVIEGQILAEYVPNSNLLAAGPTMAHTYKALLGHHFENVLLIIPGMALESPRISIPLVSEYVTPLGTIPINDTLRNELCDESDDIFLSDETLFQASALDIHLAFLQVTLGSFKLVPILIGQDDFELGKELGDTLSEVLYNHHSLIVVASEIASADEVCLTDFQEAFEHLDIGRLIRLVHSDRMEVHGMSGIIASLIVAARQQVNRGRIFQLMPPSEDMPGFFGGAVWKTYEPIS